MKGLVFEFLLGQEVSFFSKTSRPALCLTQLHIQWVSGVFGGLKRPVRKADHSPASSKDDKNKWSYTFTPLHAFTAWGETSTLCA
jgi:hypothetical protein